MAGEHAMTETEAWIPAQRHAPSPGNDATMVLPIYHVPATAAAPTNAPAAAATTGTPPQRGRGRRADALPSDERNMLIFVSALLAMGTIAIVAMATIGR